MIRVALPPLYLFMTDKTVNPILLDEILARPASETGSLQFEILSVIPDNGLSLEWLSPQTIDTTDLNWKRHPSLQHEAWLSFLGEVGWVGALLYNRATGKLLDGHMRLQDALESNMQRVPVLMVSLDEPTERKVLALLDRIGTLFETRWPMLEKLAAMVETKAANLQAILDSRGSLFGGEDEDEEGNGRSSKKKKKDFPGLISLVPGARFDYVMLIFKSELNFNTACDHFGVKPVRCAFNSGIGKGRVVDGDEYLAKVMPQVGAFPQKELPFGFDAIKDNPFLQGVIGSNNSGEVAPT